MSDCMHQTIRCLNPYEFIRKYRCNDCDAVMMCTCDEAFGRRFLPHQLNEGNELETRKRVPVTIGFHEKVCNACRGLPESPSPLSSIPGRTSKISRYYWREIFFEQTIHFDAWAKGQGYNDWEQARNAHPEKYEEVERQVLDEIKTRHAQTPKYQYKEESQNDVIERCSVAILNLRATYLKTADKRVSILADGVAMGVEDFAIHHLVKQGYTVRKTESSPFHVIFGAVFWNLIQDQRDPKVKTAGFAHRVSREMIWTLLPEDFGAPGYATRRRKAIDRHFKEDIIPHSAKSSDMLWLLNHCLEYSEDLRQYLWAHDDEDIATARAIVSALPPQALLKILRYLIDSYWARYLGWPDLLAFRGTEFLFAEVKSSSDKLSEDQKNWIQDNHSLLDFPFSLIKVHRTAVVDG